MHALLQIPTSELAKGWEDVGIVGFLVAALILVLTGFLREWIITAPRYKNDVARERALAETERSRCERLEREYEVLTKDFVRLADEYKQLMHEVIRTKP